MGYYGERKYKAIWIIGYLIFLVIAGLLCYAFADTIMASMNDVENAGWAVLGLVLAWVSFAPFLIIPVILGIIGWILTAKSNGQGAKRYKLLTFLPILVAGVSFLAMYLF